MGKVKRMLAGVFAMLFFGLAGCDAQPQNSQIETIKIGVATYRIDDTFISSLCSNLEQLAKVKENGTGKKITLSIVDGRNNQMEQNDQVDNFIAQSYDVICVNMVDRSVAAVIVDKAKKANIPLIFFNREPVEEDIKMWDKAYYVGTDAKESGILEGKIVVQAFRENPKIDKNGDGKIQYVMLEGEQSHQDSLIRTEYSVKTIVSSGISMEKLANDTANWQRAQASAKIQLWLEKYGNKIEVIINNNDDMALGAIDGLKSKDMLKNGPIVVGIDATKPALESICSGELYGTVLNDAQQQADAILNMSCDLADGKLPEKSVSLSSETIAAQSLSGVPRTDSLPLQDYHYIRVPHRVVTKKNVQKEMEYMNGINK